MTEPRWHTSQREVETSLARGPKTSAELRAETGYSQPTITNALSRAHVSASGYPKRYTLLLSSFADEELPEVTPTIQLVHIVKPLDIPMKEVGPKWQAGREKIGQEVAELDLEALSLSDAIKYFETEASSLLGVIVQLHAVKDGPDWREQIGLTP